MQVVYRRVAGIDVHASFVSVCIRIFSRKVVYEEARFGTTTRDLLLLRDWLEQHQVTHAVMEATGVYWKPVWHVLEGSVELILANAHDVRNMPGRKSDTSDPRWLADLLAHGLVRASFVPPGPVRELRDLTRTRSQLQRQLVQHQNRIGKVLEDANIKLANVLSDLLGVTGRRILKALVAGETNPGKLADLRDGRVKASREELAAALDGRFTPHHGFLVGEHLILVEHLEQRIATFEARIEAVLAPFRKLTDELCLIPGVKRRAAAAILAEIGFDMSRFPTAGHLLSWARLVPRLDESGGRQHSHRIKRGGAWLKPLLVQCAWAARRTKGSYLAAQFSSLAARRGENKAAIAVAGSILTAIFHMVRDAVPYRPPAVAAATHSTKHKTAARLASQLRALGYHVDLRHPACTPVLSE